MKAAYCYSFPRSAWECFPGRSACYSFPRSAWECFPGRSAAPCVRAVYARGGFTGYQALLQSPFCYVPHDGIVPAALTAGDLCDVAAALAPRPLRLQGLVDGANRPVTAEAIAKAYEPTREAYRTVGAEDCFDVDGTSTHQGIGAFFIEALSEAGRP